MAHFWFIALTCLASRDVRREAVFFRITFLCGLSKDLLYFEKPRLCFLRLSVIDGTAHHLGGIGHLLFHAQITLGSLFALSQSLLCGCDIWHV